MKRRKNKIIRREILKILKKRPKTINEIAKEINSTWMTARRHLKYLENIGKVELMFNGSKWRIYRLKVKS